jgi:hypothetical protein
MKKDVTIPLKPCLAACTELSATLPDHALHIPTFYFEYPPLENLLSLLDSESKHLLQGASWMDEGLQRILKSSGLRFLDDFTIVSPRAVYSINKIPVEMVRQLYVCAERMLLGFNLEKEAEIEEIEEMRREGERAQGD